VEFSTWDMGYGILETGTWATYADLIQKNYFMHMYYYAHVYDDIYAPLDGNKRLNTFRSKLQTYNYNN
jgi:hypothetical protein